MMWMPVGRPERRLAPSDGVTTLVAAWLILSPWALHMAPGLFSLNLLVVGSLVLGGQALRLHFGSDAAFTWLNVILGAWLLLSPNILEYSTDDLQTWNCILSGAAIMGTAMLRITLQALRRLSAVSAMNAPRPR